MTTLLGLNPRGSVKESQQGRRTLAGNGERFSDEVALAVNRHREKSSFPTSFGRLLASNCVPYLCVFILENLLNESAAVRRIRLATHRVDDDVNIPFTAGVLPHLDETDSEAACFLNHLLDVLIWRVIHVFLLGPFKCQVR